MARLSEATSVMKYSVVVKMCFQAATVWRTLGNPFSLYVESALIVSDKPAGSLLTAVPPTNSA